MPNTSRKVRTQKGNKYKGKYVALESFTGKKVVASGKKPADVMGRATEKGILKPVLIYVPEKNMTHVY